MKRFIALKKNNKNQTPITVKVEAIDFITVRDETIPSNVSTALISFTDGTELETVET